MNLEIPVGGETLEPEEVEKITDCPRKREQLAWLEAHGWRYEKSAAGRPVVGRLYARLKLAGVELSDAAILLQPAGPRPDFSKVR